VGINLKSGFWQTPNRLFKKNDAPSWSLLEGHKTSERKGSVYLIHDVVKAYAGIKEESTEK
jgi:hypothetical protein